MILPGKLRRLTAGLQAPETATAIIGIIRTCYNLRWRTGTRTLMAMTSMNASEARGELYRLLDEAARDHEPVLITGPRSNAVLVGEDDWNSIQETLHLLSVPGMRESIIGGLATPTDQYEKEPGW